MQCHNTNHVIDRHAATSHSHMLQEFQRRFAVCIILTLPVVFLTPMIQQWLHIDWLLPKNNIVLWLLSSVIYFYGGWPFLSGMYAEIKQKRPGMMTLIALAISVAYIYSALVVFGLPGPIFFWELATLIDIMLLGHWIEMKSVLGASKALEHLAALLPTVAHKIDLQEQVQDVPIADLQLQDRVLVKPGEKIPADGKVLTGTSQVNEAILTGESQPVVKQPGDAVIAGAINGEGALVIQIEKLGRDSFLSQVIALVQQAQSSKSNTQNLADQAGLWLTVIAIFSGVITLLIWWQLTSQGFAFSLERMVTVMVITCPHALGLAIPLVVSVSTAMAAAHGLLIRNRTAFEKARHINAVVFDKTGTLTEGQFAVTEVIMLNDRFTKNELLTYVASVESQSEHPLAKALASGVGQILPVTEFKSVPGKGVQAKVGQHSIQIASPAYAKELSFTAPESLLEPMLASGESLVFVIIDSLLCAIIALNDVVRLDAKAAIAQLHAMGIHCVMLTGDQTAVAERVAKQLGLTDYFAEVPPQQKAEKIKSIQARGWLVAMAGDGVNDAPALAQADVGIAIGAGTDVAVETADIILVRNNPLDIVSIITLARATTRKMLQNLFWATGYNVVAIPLAAGILYKFDILLSPALGAVLMSLSTVVVAINAKLLKYALS